MKKIKPLSQRQSCEFLMFTHDMHVSWNLLLVSLDDRLMTLGQFCHRLKNNTVNPQA